jgi:hypothetical protein
VNIESIERSPSAGDNKRYYVEFSENGHTTKKLFSFNVLHDAMSEKYVESRFKLIALEAWRDLQWMQGKPIR